MTSNSERNLDTVETNQQAKRQQLTVIFFL